MNTVETKMKDNVLVISLSGRISSTNAPEVEKQVRGAIADSGCENVIMDMENLDYISSAGLRVLLHVRKQFAGLKLINVNTDVYEILDMTGFTEMVEVEKAYRRLSVEGCEVIGEGANGRVYRLDADTVVKYYFNPDALPEIQRERELARKAFILGIPTAIPFDVARVGDGYGSVFELLNASSFAKLIHNEPEKLDYYVGLSVDLMKLLHSTVAKPGDMPYIKETAVGWAKFVEKELPAELGKKLVAMMEAVPTQNTVLHGDFHIKNIEMQNGEVLLIDMDTLCLGHPVFELAAIYSAYVGFLDAEKAPAGFYKFLGITTEQSSYIWKKTLSLYLGTEDEKVLTDVENKVKIISYTRILRRSIRREGRNSEIGACKIGVCLERLNELLPKVDSLSF